LRLDPHGAVRRDVVFAVAVVDPRLEDLHLAPGNLRPAQPADQLLALAAEHAAGNHFDPAAARSMLNVHFLFARFGVPKFEVRSRVRSSESKFEGRVLGPRSWVLDFLQVLAGL